MIIFLPIINTIPLLGIFYRSIYIILMILIIIIQTPTTILNFIIRYVINKVDYIGIIDNTNQLNLDSLQMDNPLSDKIINFIISRTSNSKLKPIQNITHLMIKYDKKNKIDVKDCEKIFEALDELGIKKQYLAHVGLNTEDLYGSFLKIKNNMGLIFSICARLLFDDKFNIKEQIKKYRENNIIFKKEHQ
jgi:hypothetical protein